MPRQKQNCAKLCKNIITKQKQRMNNKEEQKTNKQIKKIKSMMLRNVEVN